MKLFKELFTRRKNRKKTEKTEELNWSTVQKNFTSFAMTSCSLHIALFDKIEHSRHEPRGYHGNFGVLESRELRIIHGFIRGCGPKCTGEGLEGWKVTLKRDRKNKDFNFVPRIALSRISFESRSKIFSFYSALITFSAVAFMESLSLTDV